MEKRQGKERERGKFIVLDGIDGSGKSTQIKLLADWLRSEGKTVLVLHEPSNDNPIGRKIKRIVRDYGKKLDSKELIALFSKERIYHSKKIEKALVEGKFVLFDRYYYSTMAYQLDENKWKGYALKFIKPDLTLIFDLGINEALRRINEKNEKQHLKIAIFEKAIMLFGVRKKFLRIARQFREAKVINSEKSINSLFKDVRREVLKIK